MRRTLALSLVVHLALVFSLDAEPLSSPPPLRRLEWTEFAEARTPPPMRPMATAPRPALAGGRRRRAASPRTAPAPVDPGPGLVDLPSGDGETPASTAGEDLGTSDAGAAAGAGDAPLVRPPTHPRLVTEVRPEYPEALRDAEVQGDVELEVTVDVDGQVVFVRVVHAADEALADAAARAVRQSRWLPGTREGAPTRATVRYVYSFVLE
ncbi:MAG: TonB family protein [Myxococcaceae bacterium]|jgi:TonB family protein|nr:TonB family protein [Myxococcaceae bacterium]